MKKLILVVTHLLAVALGFGLGIYALPILIAPAGPSQAEVAAQASSARYRGEFRRDLKDSDALHWGEGKVFVGPQAVILEGELAPGPDYKLYLSPEFVETEAEFHRLRPAMVRLPQSVDPNRYDTVIVWCETFGQFITAAKYR
jgi:hypothetical protein